MHLWPTMRLRDSFKENYLKKLEWNYHRMDIEKRQQQQQRNQSDSTQQKLLETGKSDSEDSGCGGIEVVVREILMLLSCCYCCFCCGVQAPGGGSQRVEPLRLTESRRVLRPPLGEPRIRVRHQQEGRPQALHPVVGAAAAAVGAAQGRRLRRPRLHRRVQLVRAAHRRPLRQARLRRLRHRPHGPRLLRGANCARAGHRGRRRRLRLLLQRLPRAPRAAGSAGVPLRGVARRRDRPAHLAPPRGDPAGEEVRRRRAERRDVRDQRQVQAAVAARALPLHRGVPRANLVRGPHARLHTQPLLQGGVEAETCAGEPAAADDKATRRHGAGADEAEQRAAGEVQPSGHTVPHRPRRRRHCLRPGLRRAALQCRRLHGQDPPDLPRAVAPARGRVQRERRARFQRGRRLAPHPSRESGSSRRLRCGGRMVARGFKL